MVKKIDIKKFDSLAKLRELIEQINDKSDQYLFIKDEKIIAVLASPAYLESLLEKDVQEIVKEIHKKDRAKRKALEFIRLLREFNKDADPDEIQADINEAVRAVRKTEYEKLSIESS
ncbi:MAG: hypothetical protein V2J62_09650 [candidate division KSB1 bacterium]|jgi:hypothetical protein|nr:hypothetical protein [candidate division KSB1 bacterium]